MKNLNIALLVAVLATGVSQTAKADYYYDNYDDYGPVGGAVADTGEVAGDAVEGTGEVVGATTGAVLSPIFGGSSESREYRRERREDRRDQRQQRRDDRHERRQDRRDNRTNRRTLRSQDNF